MLHFYYSPFSVFARRVHVALLEKEIAHEKVLIDLPARAQRQPEYLALNPYGRVPAIDDDGFRLYESATILTYLEQTRTARPLAPQGIQGKALVDMHIRLCDLQFAPHARTIIFPKRFMPPDRWDTQAFALARTEIEAHLAIVASGLQGNDYLVGNSFSLADIAYLPFLYFLPLMEAATPPAVVAWSERLLSRPSAQATIPPK
ncbi:MAG: glutathione S-transferase family protein [Pseudomonadota bacterium]